MSIRRMNESFDKKFKEHALVESDQRIDLANALRKVANSLKNRGETSVKAYEIAFQDEIERFYPDKEWWEVTDCNIFTSLLNRQDPMMTVMDIMANIKKDIDEGYKLLSGTKVRCFRDYEKAKKVANEMGLKEAEYGDAYGISYCMWNTSGDRNEDEEVVAWYKFEGRKPVPLSNEEASNYQRKLEVDFDDYDPYYDESLKEDADEKMVIYTQMGDYYVTPKSNYGGRMQNSRKVHHMKDFESAREVMDYWNKYFHTTDDDFEVIDESKLQERGLTRAERINRASDGIFDYKVGLMDFSKKFLADKGYDEETLTKLYNSDTLDKEIIDKFGKEVWYKVVDDYSTSREHPYGDTTIEKYVRQNFSFGDRRKQDALIKYVIKNRNVRKMSVNDWKELGSRFGLTMRNFQVEESVHKNLTEGASNFWSMEKFPLLIFGQYEDIYDRVFDMTAEQLPDVDEDDIIDTPEFEENWEKYYDYCALDETEIERLAGDLRSFSTLLQDKFYEEHAEDWDGREDVEVKIKPGYYEAYQIFVPHENDLADWQVEEINDFLKAEKEKFGLTELGVDWQASNGETGYKVKESLSPKERREFISKMTKALMGDKFGYSHAEANDIAIKRADALGSDWRVRWGGDIDKEIKQELENTISKVGYRAIYGIMADESLNEAVDPQEFYKMIIRTKGNPSIKDFMSVGYSEGSATEMVARLGSSLAHTPDVLVRTAERMLKDTTNESKLQERKNTSPKGKESAGVRELIDVLEAPKGLAKKYGYKLTPDKLVIVNGGQFPITKVQYNRLKELGYGNKNESLLQDIQDDMRALNSANGRNMSDMIDEYEKSHPHPDFAGSILYSKDLWDDFVKWAKEEKGFIVKPIRSSSFDDIDEDTVKQGSQWVNKGKEGTHGKFKTKKEADAQRKAIWANWHK